MIRASSFYDEIHEMQIQTTEQVCETFKISRSTLYRLSKNYPGFPKPLYFGRAIRWNLADIFEFYAQQRHAPQKRA
ncbi:helix-turn-helix domain-containing protein [Pseudomonas asturiensis]|uniref:Helix-turn-helix domain-containing protein n=1 Tax=Pseudomonas asturiensis TaxID=1190415 RepID=A0ABX6HKK9_9PSED|nr:helix-turn-helix domain-containing protein [Pseudomonas asturiensis]